jgi:hypothetical protein
MYQNYEESTTKNSRQVLGTTSFVSNVLHHSATHTSCSPLLFLLYLQLEHSICSVTIIQRQLHDTMSSPCTAAMTVASDTFSKLL